MEKQATIYHKDSIIFQGIKNPFVATRYHSLIVEQESLPNHFYITAKTKDGTIMGLEVKHKRHLYGVQFHPESILTSCGKKIVYNFFQIAMQN